MYKWEQAWETNKIIQHQKSNWIHSQRYLGYFVEVAKLKMLMRKYFPVVFLENENLICRSCTRSIVDMFTEFTSITNICSNILYPCRTYEQIWEALTANICWRLLICGKQSETHCVRIWISRFSWRKAEEAWEFNVCDLLRRRGFDLNHQFCRLTHLLRILSNKFGKFEMLMLPCQSLSGSITSWFTNYTEHNIIKNESHGNVQNKNPKPWNVD